MSSIPYSLRPLLGDDPAAVTAGQLEKLIGEPESQQADWKRQLDANDKTKLDLGADVAAFANATGGLIVVGLDENDRGEATTFVGVTDPKRPDYADWANAVIRSRVSPPPPFSVHRIEGPEGVDVVLIAVDPSEASPHAALDGSKLSYPVRSGTGKRYLSEPEVADAYGRRLRRIAGQDARTDELRRAAVPKKAVEGDVAWLVVTIAPARPGNGRIEPGDVERFRDLLETGRLRRLPSDSTRPWNPSIGHRAVIATDFNDTQHQRAVLGVDGSGSAAIRWPGKSDGIVPRNLTMITTETCWLLSTLVANAVERGVSGTASASIEVLTPTNHTLQVSAGAPGIDSGLFDIPTHRGPTPVGLHTIDLDAVALSMTGLLAATHLLASDLATVFGYAALRCLTPEGALRPSGFSRNRHDLEFFVQWAAENGVRAEQ